MPRRESFWKEKSCEEHEYGEEESWDIVMLHNDENESWVRMSCFMFIPDRMLSFSKNGKIAPKEHYITEQEPHIHATMAGMI